jgi:flagellar basal-body rod protein FlgC
VGDGYTIFDISASALMAERRRMDLIANNIANAKTTHGVDGKPYQRKYAIFKTILEDEGVSLDEPGYFREKGVKVDRIVTDKSPFLKVYDPSHPDADEKGYVEYPNVNVIEEMVDLIAASRAYEANVAVIKTTKQITQRALEFLRI